MHVLDFTSACALFGAVRNHLGADQWQTLALASCVGQALSEILHQGALLPVCFPLFLRDRLPVGVHLYAYTSCMSALLEILSRHNLSGLAILKAGVMN
jgi:hypothetical protein